MSQKPEKILCQAKVIAMGEEVEPQNDLYLSLKMVFLTSEENLNHVEFLTEFIDGIVEEQQKYVTMPIVVDLANLLAGKYDKLTHKFSKNKFGTQQIGSFYKFEKQQNGNVSELIAYGRIWKRDEKVIAALQELYESEEGLRFSYECYIGKYISENGKKIIPRDPSNNPIGSCIVSFPAVLQAKALLLAEELEQDLNLQEGGVEVSEIVRDVTRTMEDMFANAKICLESAELDLDQIRRKIYNGLQSIFKNDWYNYDIIMMFLTYVIVQHYSTGDYYKVSFTTTDDEVTLSDPVKVTITFVEKANKEVQEMATIADLEAKVKDLEDVITSKDAIIADKEKIISNKDTEIASLNEKINALSQTVVAKDNEIAELQKAKEELDVIKAEKEKAKLAEKKEALKAKYSKLLSEEIMKEPEIAQAIENLDEKVLNERVVKIALEKAEKTLKDEKKDEKKTETASRMTDNIQVNGGDVVSKYVTVNN